MARAAGSAPQVGVEDPENLCGPPIYSWEGSGTSAWWFCRLCGANVTEGHLGSTKHMSRRKDWSICPSNWKFHLSHYKSPANQKPDSPPGTLEPQPALTDAPATENRPDLLDLLGAPPGLNASQETITEVEALRSEVAALRNTVATLSNEMETLRNEMSQLSESVTVLVRHASDRAAVADRVQ